MLGLLPLVKIHQQSVSIGSQPLWPTPPHDSLSLLLPFSQGVALSSPGEAAMITVSEGPLLSALQLALPENPLETCVAIAPPRGISFSSTSPEILAKPEWSTLQNQKRPFHPPASPTYMRKSRSPSNHFVFCTKSVFKPLGFLSCPGNGGSSVGGEGKSTHQGEGESGVLPCHRCL